jgi:hypothetical protein
LSPQAVLLVPVVLASSAVSPQAVLYKPVVRSKRALVPIAVLPFESLTTTSGG